MLNKNHYFLNFRVQPGILRSKNHGTRSQNSYLRRPFLKKKLRQNHASRPGKKNVETGFSHYPGRSSSNVAGHY